MINRIRIKNFKSLKDVDLALGPLNVLVGPNMGGKSNILDAFFFLQQFLTPQAGIEVSISLCHNAVELVRFSGRGAVRALSDST